MTNGGVVTIADDAVTAAKIDETADVTVASLTTTGSAGIDMNNLPITEAKTITFNGVVDNGSTNTSLSVYFINGQYQKVTFTSGTSATITFDTTNLKVGAYSLTIINGGLITTMDYGAEGASNDIYWPGATEPTLTAAGRDRVSCLYDGEDFDCDYSVNLQVSP
jgi:hypothetical protein